MKKAVIFCDSSPRYEELLESNLEQLIEIGWPEVSVAYVYSISEAKKIEPDEADMFFVHSESFTDVLLDGRFHGKVVNRLSMSYDELELVPDQYITL